MLPEIKKKLDSIGQKIKDIGSIFNFDRKEADIAHGEELMSQSHFWQNQEAAQKTIREINALRAEVKTWHEICKKYQELREFSTVVNDSDLPLMQEISTHLQELKTELEKLETLSLLRGEYDINNAIVSIHPGAGGTESCDWAQMLLRMYLRWAEKRGYHSEILEFLAGEEAGIKSVTFVVEGEYSYGYLKAEKGVHRLVRISPFDANRRRHTSFASLEVLPEIKESEIVIREEDIKIDTFRSSSAGGQNVNKVETAIRITHLPTGIVVHCQSERSQLQNRLNAMKLLRAQLFEIHQKEKEEKLIRLTGEKKEIAWGNQIRSYVFHPYNLVKDHRTGVESGDVNAVIDGEIDVFIQAYLRKFYASKAASGKAGPIDKSERLVLK